MAVEQFTHFTFKHLVEPFVKLSIGKMRDTIGGEIAEQKWEVVAY